MGNTVRLFTSAAVAFALPSFLSKILMFFPSIKMQLFLPHGFIVAFLFSFVILLISFLCSISPRQSDLLKQFATSFYALSFKQYLQCPCNLANTLFFGAKRAKGPSQEKYRINYPLLLLLRIGSNF
jgi:hypothetical protein